ncbi:signal peptide peptidase SppA [Oceanivirga salmonicida]|uniref:signal peptide peptidase SppA n=1 Tax=Oceanivirga salmonicida TaxID=1769291 RepID=UPI00082EC6B3|nr:signal peptide peptidase SppA [Oceanivirga salmonicida]
MQIIYILLNSIVTTIFIVLILALIFLLIFLKIKQKDDGDGISQKKAKTILISSLDIIYDKKISLLDEKVSFLTLKKKLEAMVNDDKIEKIILDLDELELTQTQSEELEPIFNNLKKKKEVIAVASIFTRQNYLTALLASKIYLVKTKNSYLMIQAYSRKLPYYKNLLDKLGITVKAIHVGDFKSYGENYKLDEMSDNLKENLTRLYDKNLEYFIEKVKQYRNIDITNDIVDGNIFLKDDYKGLIDGKIHKYKLINEDEKLMNISSYKPKKKKKKSKNIISVMSLEGSISKTGLCFDEVYKKVKKIKELDNLKGLVIEINSPGGSAYESSLIHSMLKQEFKNIPIFISMKDVCASGGYFIASSGQKIFANKSTITGSIGVVALYPNFKNLLDKIGVNYSGIQKGETTEFGDLTQELSPKSETLFQNQMIQVYEEFKKVVMRARIMTDKKLEPIAGGRVWTGLEAKEIGLVDKIGTLDDTIKELAKYLKIEDYKLVHVEKEIKLKNEIKGKIPLLSLDKSLLNIPLMLYIN